MQSTSGGLYARSSVITLKFSVKHHAYRVENIQRGFLISLQSRQAKWRHVDNFCATPASEYGQTLSIRTLKVSQKVSVLTWCLCIKRGCVAAVQFILFNFANYSPSIAMELKLSKEITCKWQNQRSETNKCASWALFLKLQAAGINFEKLLGWTVFKNPNFNPFQSSSVLPIRGICCFCYVILTFL